jgi:hypothetical protein
MAPIAQHDKDFLWFNEGSARGPNHNMASERVELTVELVNKADVAGEEAAHGDRDQDRE